MHNTTSYLWPRGYTHMHTHAYSHASDLRTWLKYTLIEQSPQVITETLSSNTLSLCFEVPYYTVFCSALSRFDNQLQASINDLQTVC